MHLGVDAVPELGRGELGAPAYDVSEAFVGGDLPLNRDPPVRHATAGERIRGEAGPQHHAFWPRFARCDAERERVADPLARRTGRQRIGGREPGRGEGDGTGRPQSEEVSSIDRFESLADMASNSGEPDVTIPRPVVKPLANLRRTSQRRKAVTETDAVS